MQLEHLEQLHLCMWSQNHHMAPVYIQYNHPVCFIYANKLESSTVTLLRAFILAARTDCSVFLLPPSPHPVLPVLCRSGIVIQAALSVYYSLFLKLSHCFYTCSSACYCFYCYKSVSLIPVDWMTNKVVSVSVIAQKMGLAVSVTIYLANAIFLSQPVATWSKLWGEIRPTFQSSGSTAFQHTYAPWKP